MYTRISYTYTYTCKLHRNNHQNNAPSLALLAPACGSPAVMATLGGVSLTGRSDAMRGGGGGWGVVGRPLDTRRSFSNAKAWGWEEGRRWREEEEVEAAREGGCVCVCVHTNIAWQAG